MLFWGLVLALLMLIVLIDPKGHAFLSTFTFGRYGIRYIRRFQTTSDSLANFMIFVCLFFSMVFGFLPEFKYMYAVLLLFSLACCLAQCIDVSKNRAVWKQKVVVASTFLVGAIGLYVNFHSSALQGTALLFCQDVLAHRTNHIVYFLENVQPFAYALMATLYMVPVFVLWTQFKYMRLEHDIKALSLSGYVVKMGIVSVLLIILYLAGLPFLMSVYHLALPKV